MDFVTVEGRTLRSALLPLVDVVESRKTIPILGHVRLSLAEDGLHLAASDLDIDASTRLDVMAGHGGFSLCLPARPLMAIARVAGPMALRIAPCAEGAKVLVTLGEDEASYELTALPAADFPGDIVRRGELLETFPNGQLAAQLARLRAFISTEETRYYLNGVYWHRGPRGSRLVATDGRRLVCCRISPDPMAEIGRIIPRKTVALICRHMAGADVRVYGPEGDPAGLGLVFEAGGLTLRSKLIDGTYPNFDRIVGPCLAREAEKPQALALNRLDVTAALRRLQALGRERGRAVKFAGEAGRLVLTRSGGEVAIRASTATPWPEGLAPFGANAGYFTDMIAGCTGEIALIPDGAGGPMLIRDSDPEMLRVLMPMAV